MNQLQKYTWLIETIRRAGKISHKDLSEKWERCKDLSDYKPLPRATFNRWRDAIYEQFSIDIQCQKVGGYLYFIANPENIDDDKLKKWMLDSFAVGNTIGENLSLKGRYWSMKYHPDVIISPLSSTQCKKTECSTCHTNHLSMIEHIVFLWNHIASNFAKIDGIC